MEADSELSRRPRRLSVKRMRRQDKEGLAKQAAQAEAMLRKQSLVAEVRKMDMEQSWCEYGIGEWVRKCRWKRERMSEAVGERRRGKSSKVVRQ